MLIGKGLGLPRTTTKLLVDKLGGFEKTIEDKVIEFERSKFNVYPAFILDDNKEKFLNLINETIFNKEQ